MPPYLYCQNGKPAKRESVAGFRFYEMRHFGMGECRALNVINKGLQPLL